MSTYVREKVLRVPLDKLNLEYMKNKLKEIDEDYEDDFAWYLESVFPDLFKYATVKSFQTSPTETPFFDYVLEYEYDADGEYGKVRDLYESEKIKYLPVFQKLDKNVNMDDVKLVEFCWYNGTEAPDYYDLTDDPFYEEI